MPVIKLNRTLAIGEGPVNVVAGDPNEFAEGFERVQIYATCETPSGMSVDVRFTNRNQGTALRPNTRVADSVVDPDRDSLLDATMRPGERLIVDATNTDAAPNDLHLHINKVRIR